MKTIKDCIAAIEGLRAEIDSLNTKIVELETRPTSKRNYGPSSTTSMTNEIAWRILHGTHTSSKVKDIADEFGLSRGQVYSVRGGYTFTAVKEDDFTIDEDNNIIAK